jgi:HSP20 family protein
MQAGRREQYCNQEETMATTKSEKNDDKTGERGQQTSSSQQGAQNAGGQSSRALTRREDRSGALARSPGSLGPLSLMRWLFDGLGGLTGVNASDTSALERRDLDGLMFVPNIDVMRRDDKLVVRVDLPGMSVDDIQVTVDDGVLIIEGERRSEHEQQDGNVRRCERSYGQFQRVIPLPEGADPTTTDARFENGVLEISLRAPEPAKQGRKIDVKTSGEPSDTSKQAGSH